MNAPNADLAAMIEALLYELDVDNTPTNVLAARIAEAVQRQVAVPLHIVFDGPPGHEAGRFVEVETPDGRSVNTGVWRERADGCWELIIAAAPQPPAAPSAPDKSWMVENLSNHCGADAEKWAKQFRFTALELGYSDMDEGWLIGWFANAIERAVDVRYSQPPAATAGEPDEVKPYMWKVIRAAQEFIQDSKEGDFSLSTLAALDAQSIDEALARMSEAHQKAEVAPPAAIPPAARANIRLTQAEIQSGLDRQRWAELLISQLPKNHDGRNTWLLNHGVGDEAQAKREARGLTWNEDSRAINPPAAPTDEAKP